MRQQSKHEALLKFSQRKKRNFATNGK